ncbi:MAG TPA: hypothetical protein VFV80_14570 [Geminicoccaceae bacterium]|nr:hypothetical protein [Geminicoccaceae bacterium]
MQNRSMFPYRRHGPKKRVKHGPNRKARGPQKGLPNSARDLLPLLQPATKALAQVLAGRANASGQLGHARTMLAQAERMIAERAHNRLTPAEREEFFEQLARLKLTLADADAEAEVQAVEQHEPRPQPVPVAQERLKEMALALSGRERPGAKGGRGAAEPADERDAGAAAPQADEGPHDARTAAAAEPERAARAREPEAGAAESGAAPRRDRLVLPRASAEQAVQALAIGSLARRRNRPASWAAAASAAGESAGLAGTAATDPTPPAAFEQQEPVRDTPDEGERPEADAPETHGGNGAAADAEPRRNAGRRARKPKNQGLPEGWVIDDEGFVVPGAG